MTSLILRSFAKINLSLDVLDKRPDGYHNIQSVMQTISLHDDLTISKREDSAISITSTDAGVPSGERNLAHRAAVVFFEARGARRGVEIHIAKHIPMQAGLGGGSGNAASTLVGLNALFETGFIKQELRELSARVGSDAPFFLSGGTALIRGRGEVVEELPDLALEYVIVKPDFGAPTAWAYEQLDALGATSAKASSQLAQAVAQGNAASAVVSMSNDFQPVVEKAYPEIASVAERLKDSGADRAMLAGSGSAVVGVFLDAQAADEVYAALREEYPLVFRARTMLRKESDLHAIIRRAS